MIERYVQDDALNAQEPLLLVPLPIFQIKFDEGFAGQITRRFPLMQEALKKRDGITLGDFEIVPGVMHNTADNTITRKPYDLVLAGIHERNQRGWQNAPQALANVLQGLVLRGKELQIATAGIPGTGFSGLRGDADIEAIKQALEDNNYINVSVYQDSYAGDRAEVLYADPALDASSELERTKA